MNHDDGTIGDREARADAFGAAMKRVQARAAESAAEVRQFSSDLVAAADDARTWSKRQRSAKQYVRISVPVGGCCEGHRCDSCATCLTGRCCRSDNPAYELPSFGSWPFAIFGVLGVLEQDCDGVRCHICGEWFRSLNGHVKKHDVTAREYRAYFGIKRTRPLERTATTEMRQRVNGARWTTEGLARFQEIGRAALAALTPEQRSARYENPSLEAVEAWRASAEKTNERVARDG